MDNTQQRNHRTLIVTEYINDIRKQLNPKETFIRVVTPGTSLAGYRFDLVLIDDSVFELPHPHLMEWINTSVKTKLVPSGKIIYL